MESVEPVDGLASYSDTTSHHLIRTRCYSKLFTYINSFNPQNHPFKLGSVIISVLHGQDPKHRGLSW